jgi:hypothetical protein
MTHRWKTPLGPSHQGPRTALPQAPPSPLVGLKEGTRCPRPHCGGLLMLRAVVTIEGSCDELVCASCARSRVLALREPYRPIPVSRDPRFDEPRERVRPGAAALDTEDSMGIVAPGDETDARALYTVLFDADPLVPPLDSQ